VPFNCKVSDIFLQNLIFSREKIENVSLVAKSVQKKEDLIPKRTQLSFGYHALRFARYLEKKLFLCIALLLNKKKLAKII
jgi:hypothetical protein